MSRSRTIAHFGISHMEKGDHNAYRYIIAFVLKTVQWLISLEWLLTCYKNHQISVKLINQNERKHNEIHENECR
jgi:hypothetical protein